MPHSLPFATPDGRREIDSQIILQTTFCQKVVFAEKPDLATRRAMAAAGFRFNGSVWISTRGTTATLHPHELAGILAAMTPRTSSGLTPPPLTPAGLIP